MMSGSKPNEVGGEHNHTETVPQKGNARGVVIAVFVVLLLLIVGAVTGVMARGKDRSDLEKYTAANAAPTVDLVAPKQQGAGKEVILPGNMQAFTLAPIYARTTGYVRSWTHDIGSHVHKGELLAVIETPELDQQLAQAKADLETAKTNAGIAKVTSDRYQDLVQRNAVSQQDTDNAVSVTQARNAAVQAAEANVRRLQELVGFEHITAPFDGVITARNLDVGQLITATGATVTAGAGTNVSSRQVFDLSNVNKLRVFVNVPQMYTPEAKVGMTADLTLPQFPGKSFTGKLVRTANAVDPGTRTLLVEVDVENRTGELLPGSYTEVHLKSNGEIPVLIIPVTALILNADGLRVATVDAQNKAHMIPVTTGRDFGTTVEVLSGLNENQKVIANPADSLSEGDTVRVVEPNQNQKGNQ
ncbi:MAG: efflux RND transporter periplasmic adaptor subunit [Edaphobacter sp.]|uniref:efflux RND transporter periplasmic adaptor subunit n=1 Tax=Edaphobacter sp. TaxID=1934404 RepID=UPI002395EA96|nr:efflux RND transporter periplasmic adaptor subunit [Edaphobacter sp.]MDE1178458.1 efflux RND transporter periplasmic adaptor subunit [Edaphobacter sp.]